MRMSSLARTLAGAAAALGTASAHALCTLVCSCSASTSPVVFGAYAALGNSASDAAGGVAVSCGGVAGLLISYTVELGAGGSGNEAARQMRSAGGTLNYGLYRDAARSLPWGSLASGNAVRGSIPLDLLGSSRTVNYTVYGRIPAGQRSTVPGSYADTLVVTVTYD